MALLEFLQNRRARFCLAFFSLDTVRPSLVERRAITEPQTVGGCRFRLCCRLGCGIAGIAGSAFTMIGSTGPTSGQLYIVDTFLIVVFGGAASLLGTIASAFSISQTQSTLEFFLSGSMAKVITLLAVVGILMLRPQGLFTLKVRR